MTRKMIVLVGVLMLVASACATREDTTQAVEPSVLAMPPTTVVSAAEAVSDSSGQASEGIQVHGHWTIEVRDPDGSISGRVEFDNALTAGGGHLLLGLLNGDLSAGDWGITLQNDSSLCSGTRHCPIADVQALETIEPSGLSTLVTVSGSLTATNDGSIMGVDTTKTVCGPSASPWDCKTGGAAGAPGTVLVLTEKTLEAPVAVAGSQTVYVEVEISFS